MQNDQPASSSPADRFGKLALARFAKQICQSAAVRQGKG